DYRGSHESQFLNRLFLAPRSADPISGSKQRVLKKGLKMCITGDEQYRAPEDLGSHVHVPLFVTLVNLHTSQCDGCNSLHRVGSEKGSENRGSSASLEKAMPQRSGGL